ncbi:hypothetical protein F0562_013815 [Nyssa sinensis]|uniref:X8 domain-containing protein n=1 Tax=Nyssa sinensis TaxID=561372 RepID=A0A5J4ZR54_9ASTE|nr:hypothetical protein F0562_013815 [Nyssa sinensis]
MGARVLQCSIFFLLYLFLISDSSIAEKPPPEAIQATQETGPPRETNNFLNFKVALDYACGYGGADCSAIQTSATCYNPNTLRDHASYAFNNYYQKSPNPTSCVFGGTAQLTYTDPSSGNCHFASATTTPTTTPSTTSPNNPTPPSSTNTPTTPSASLYPATPSGPTDYGSEPTGTPSSADSASYNLVLLFTVTSLALLAANSL